MSYFVLRPSSFVPVVLCGLLSIISCNKAPTRDAGMVLVTGGTFQMGTDHGYPYEGPAHSVTVGSFYIDRTEVTNRSFQEFVTATHYVTEAERLGWSGVFNPEVHDWTPLEGANWEHPEGPGSSIEKRLDHPVVHISWSDTAAYARWAGKRLPTEAEWEWAARGGRSQAEYPWGDKLMSEGRHHANTWQGHFPTRDEAGDGFVSTAPACSFPPNGYGLCDMSGNVWEWTADWFADDYFRKSAGITNPRGPDSGNEKVIRGGSWLCAENYCTGYRVAARQKTPIDSGLNNLGFRCAKDK